MAADKVIVLDFGGQYAHLIANRVRRLGVYSEILDPTASLNELRKARGLILSGGPESVYDRRAPKYNPELFSLERPILGICYGEQLMVHDLGGVVKPGKTKEYGKAFLRVKKRSKLFKGLGKREWVWMSHGDRVEALPPGFEFLGETSDCPFAAIGDAARNYYGVQFHPEVTHTPRGMRLLKNFVFGVCKARKSWNVKSYLKRELVEIRKKARGKNVFLLVSGGVDSLVAMALLSKALGRERVYGLHIDTGFMRKNESSLVEQALLKLDFAPLHVLDASEDFYGALKGVTGPEKKRNAIGKLFLDLANRELKRLNMHPGEWLLGQGTIYPDTIESAGTKHAHKIKTHHNRIESINELIRAGRVIEPLAQLYKDEVRALGRELGLPSRLVERHPFPGPGLAIRTLCSNGKRLAMPAAVKKKVVSLAKEFGFIGHVLPVKSVGVQGDARTYSWVALLEGSGSYDELEKAATKIANSIKHVNRVAWLVSPRKAKTLWLQKGFLSRERLDLLREADDRVFTILRKHRLYDHFWQFPVILAPVGVNGKGEAIVLRPVYSREAMTAAFGRMPRKALNEIVRSLMALEGVTAVLYDVTHKPPATICWE